MKRIMLAAFSTLAALVLLFSYPTSTGQSGSTAAEPVSSAKVITGAETGAASSTGQGPDPATTGGRAALEQAALGQAALERPPTPGHSRTGTGHTDAGRNIISRPDIGHGGAARRR